MVVGVQSFSQGLDLLAQTLRQCHKLMYHTNLKEISSSEGTHTINNLERKTNDLSLDSAHLINKWSIERFLKLACTSRDKARLAFILKNFLYKRNIGEMWSTHNKMRQSIKKTDMRIKQCT